MWSRNLQRLRAWACLQQDRGTSFPCSLSGLYGGPQKSTSWKCVSRSSPFVSDWCLPCPAIPGALVQLLGVSEKQWEIWVEMELAQFSIPFTCRKCVLHTFFRCVLVLTLYFRCQHSAFVDKQDLEANPEIHCPFPACDHVWCKRCQQTIDPSGPKHSCDGTSELDHLMKQQGWRYCPSEWNLTPLR